MTSGQGPSKSQDPMTGDFSAGVVVLEAAGGVTVRRFGNRRYSRFGDLRYGEGAVGGRGVRGRVVVLGETEQLEPPDVGCYEARRKGRRLEIEKWEEISGAVECVHKQK